MIPEKQVLLTARQVVDALDGATVVAGMCRVTVSAVSNWCRQGWIPAVWFDAMRAALRGKGYDVDPRVFRQQPLKASDHATADM